MNTHDKIELPTLPEPFTYIYPGKSEGALFHAGHMQDYALAAIEANRKQQGEVVVTKDESGAIVAVTRQDEEGRILSVIAEADRKLRGEPVKVPSDADLLLLWEEVAGGPKNNRIAFGRALLARYGQPAQPTTLEEKE